MTLTRLSTIATLAVLSLATLGPVTPASAGGIIERNNFDYAFDDSFKDCGTTIDYHREGTVSSMIREANGRTDGQFFFYGENYTFRETFTDRGTITMRYIFDTLGDSQPGGEFLSEELVSAKGLFQSEDLDFCSLLT